MHKTEPKIVAPGYTNEEIYEWMAKKLAAINQLREVLSYRQGNDSNLLIVFYVQIMPDDFVMQLHRF